MANWRIHANGKVTVHFEVPFGCSDTTVLPGTDGEKMKLSPGVFERTYLPKQDYRKIYTMETRLEELPFMFFMGFNPQMVEKAAEKILLLDTEWV